MMDTPRPAPADFPKRDDRLTTILLVARLSTENWDDLCRIRNVSSGGMRLETRAALVTGERVGIDLKNGNAVAGVVVWTDRFEVGVQFDQPVDIVALLAPTAQSPRSLRLSARCPVVLRLDGHIVPGLLQNISQGGTRVVLATPARLNDGVVVVIPGLKSQRASVRWVAPGTVGLAFSETVAFADLSHWLAQQHRFSATSSAPLSPNRQSS